MSKAVQASGPPQIDRSVQGKPFSIAGRKFTRGLGAHAVSILAIDLKGGAERFTAFVGVDDEVNTMPGGTVDFCIIGDGRTLWKSGVMKSGQPAQSVDVNLKGIETVILKVGDAGDTTWRDDADWADAKFEVTGEKPLTTPAPQPKREEAIILTPSPPATPRTNGARIFGVRPGHPFLFTIPATGQRPMQYAVDHLPRGLKLDSRTGQITGALKKPGEYVVTLRAQNSLGRSERKFKIVCGDTLALTPHMGWNSWYIWADRITDKIMRDAADAMISSGMIDHGYMYVNMDDSWTVKPGSKDPLLSGPARDAEGNIIPNKRFPDMKALTDDIHSKGLKAGIYTGLASITCAGHAGCYQHEEQDARQYAKWGFDFLKLDSCPRDKLPQMAAILKKLDRDIVLNVVAGPSMETIGEWLRAHDVTGVHSWRTSNDLGGLWGHILPDIFGLYGRNEIQRYSGPGGWNDPITSRWATFPLGRRRSFRPTSNMFTCRSGAWSRRRSFSAATSPGSTSSR